MVFVDAPGRRHVTWRWATPLVLVLCVGAFALLAFVDRATHDALLLRWGALSAAAADWRSLLQPEQIRPLLAAEDTAVRALVFTRSADGVAQRTLYGRDPSGLVSRP
jgi:hypothetical protein